MCAMDSPISASARALAAVGVHKAVMLAVAGLIATGVCRGFDGGQTPASTAQAGEVGEADVATNSDIRDHNKFSQFRTYR